MESHREMPKWGIFRGILKFSMNFLAKEEAIFTLPSHASPSVVFLLPTGVQPLQFNARFSLSLQQNLKIMFCYYC